MQLNELSCPKLEWSGVGPGPERTCRSLGQAGPWGSLVAGSEFFHKCCLRVPEDSFLGVPPKPGLEEVKSLLYLGKF